MPDAPQNMLTDYLRRLSARAAERTDADLLACFAHHQDEEAFTLLVRRHGPVVLGACRRILGQSADAEDAFQAVFLALARNAGRIRGCLPGWLYRVAVRTARKALARHPVPTRGPEMATDGADPFAAIEWQEVRRILDLELSQLPDRWRSPLVLCYLDGLSRDEAARQLGWSRRTLHRRLEEGRTALRNRLIRRGLGASGLAAAILQVDGLRAEVPAPLARDAAAIALRHTVVSPGIRALAGRTAPFGGLVMKAIVSVLILVVGTILVFGERQPAGADPTPPPPTAPTLLARAPAKTEKPDDPLARQVREAQDRGIAYLKGQQKKQAGDIWNWESDPIGMLQTGGSTALAMLALLESGVKVDDPVLVRGLQYLRTVEPKHTYVVSLQTQVFCRANQKDDVERIKRNVQWLEEAAVWNAGQLTGWSYLKEKTVRGDNSNTRYAIAALHAAHTAGFKVSQEKFWEAVRDHYVRTQLPDGGWGYTPETNKATHTMTVSGVLCLNLATRISGKESKAAQESIRNGFAWIGERLQFQSPPHTFYNFDVIAALGRAMDQKELGTGDKKREWYREGTEWLLKNQKAGGEWQLKQAIDDFPVISTSFALRFLASRPR